MALEVNVTLSLPRDTVTVPVVRHLCDDTLAELGVTDQCRHDIVVAMTEACTNIIEHCSVDRPYEVQITLDEQQCVVCINDPANAFDIDAAATKRVSHRTSDGDGDGGDQPLPETGRGIDLMNALVDDVRFARTGEPGESGQGQGQGMVVVLSKALEFDESHPVRRHLAGSAPWTTPSAPASSSDTNKA